MTAPVSSPAGEDVERVARDLARDLFAAIGNHGGWNGKSARGESVAQTLAGWGWTAALSARPVEAQEVEVAHRAVAMLAFKMQAERDAALARAEAAEVTLAALEARVLVELARAWGVDEHTARLRLTGRP